MTRPPFTNLDAEYLATLGDTFIQDGDFDTGLRLSGIAEHLQHLDTTLLIIQKDGQFAAGVREAYARTYGRSNLPPEVRTVSKQMAEALALTSVQPRRIAGAKAEPSVKKYAHLHIKLEL